MECAGVTPGGPRPAFPFRPRASPAQPLWGGSGVPSASVRNMTDEERPSGLGCLAVAPYCFPPTRSWSDRIGSCPPGVSPSRTTGCAGRQP